MDRTRYFLVAGHLFGLSLPEDGPIWGLVERQYGPFEVENGFSGEGSRGGHTEAPIFRLKLSDSIPDGHRKCLYDVPTEKGETAVRLSSCDGGWIFEIMKDSSSPVCGTVFSNADFSEACLKLESGNDMDILFCVNNAAMLLYAFATSPHGTLAFHSSVIGNNGRAYLFLGTSGTGKSTHSRLWLKYIDGSTLMNDDNPIVRIWPDGRIIAYGSPWSGKTPCYKNVSAPVGALVQLKQAPANSIQRMNVLDSYASLLSSISGLKDGPWKMADELNDSISALLGAVPCWELACLPDREAAELCFKTVTHVTQ